jgi:uncharacterized membrane protein YeiH
VAPIVGATAYLMLQAAGLEHTYAALAGMATIVALPLAAILWKVRLPVVRVPQ